MVSLGLDKQHKLVANDWLGVCKLIHNGLDHLVKVPQRGSHFHKQTTVTGLTAMELCRFLAENDHLNKKNKVIIW